MDWAQLISGVVSGLLDFLKPVDDTVVVYDIRKKSGNTGIWIIMGVLVLLVIGIILTIILTR